MLQSLAARRRVPILGKIRLGERRENQAGKEFPVNVPYFVLDDAPGVAEVYGEKPASIEIVFPTNDMEAVTPSAFRWFSAGRKDKGGNPIGGKRICQGNGALELPDGTFQPGVATWYDRSRKPPEDEIISIDAVAGRCSRVCWGDRCVDAKDEKGYPKCRMGMQLFVILPRVSFDGVFQIDTTSRNSMPQIHDQLVFMQNGPRGGFAWIPFRLYKKEIPVNPVDPRTGETVPGTQQIIALEVWEKEFDRLYGADTKKALQQLKGSAQQFLPSPDEIEATTMEDNYPMLEAGEAELAATVETKVNDAKGIANDPEILSAFAEYGKVVMNKQLSEKDRMLLIRKKEGSPDLKAAVLESIARGIDEHKKKAQAKHAAKETAKTSTPPPAKPQAEPQAAPPQQPAVQANPSTPQPDEDGII